MKQTKPTFLHFFIAIAASFLFGMEDTLADCGFWSTPASCCEARGGEWKNTSRSGRAKYQCVGATKTADEVKQETADREELEEEREEQIVRQGSCPQGQMPEYTQTRRGRRPTDNCIPDPNFNPNLIGDADGGNEIKNCYSTDDGDNMEYIQVGVGQECPAGTYPDEASATQAFNSANDVVAGTDEEMITCYAQSKINGSIEIISEAYLQREGCPSGWTTNRSDIESAIAGSGGDEMITCYHAGETDGGRARVFEQSFPKDQGCPDGTSPNRSDAERAIASTDGDNDGFMTCYSERDASEHDFDAEEGCPAGFTEDKEQADMMAESNKDETTTGDGNSGAPSYASNAGDPLRKSLKSDKDFVSLGQKKPTGLGQKFTFSILGNICERESSVTWDIAAGRESGEGSTAYNGLLTEFDAELKNGDVVPNGGTESVKKAQASYGNEVVKKFNAIAKTVLLCEAFRSVHNHTDFEDEDMLNQRDKEGSGTNMLTCTNNPNPQQCMMQAMQSQKQMKCKNNGVETQDFLMCKTIMNTIDGFFLAKTGLNSIQGIRAQDKQMDAQIDLMKKQNKGEGISGKDVLEDQRDSVKQQSQMAYERFTVDAAQAATLWALYDKMPTRKKLLKECEENQQNYQSYVSALNELKGRYPAELGSANIPADMSEITSTCSALFKKEAATSLILNDAARDAIKQAMIRAGLDAVENAAKGKILADQADKIDDAVKDWEDPEDPEFQTFEQQEMLASECLANPEAEGCIPPDGGGRTIGMMGSNFNMSSPDYANSGTPVDLNDAGADGNQNVVGGNGKKRKLLPKGFGGVVQGSGNDNGFSGSNPGVGSMKKAGDGSAGGGGGFSVGGSSLTGSKAKGAVRRGKGKRSGFRNVAMKTRGGRFSLGGGRGLKGATRKKGKKGNPFASLLGKKGRKPASKTLNFGKKQIGGKKGSIFDMISNRYSAVAEKKRLLEYEVK